MVLVSKTQAKFRKYQFTIHRQMMSLGHARRFGRVHLMASQSRYGVSKELQYTCCDLTLDATHDAETLIGRDFATKSGLIYGLSVGSAKLYGAVTGT